MRPQIRNAKSEEYNEIIALVKDAYAQYRNELSAEIWDEWMQSIDDDVASEHGQLIVVEIEGKIQGSVQFFADATQSTLACWPKGTSVMRMLCIRPASSGKGYGTLLAEECVGRAREIGASAMFVQTGTFMKAAQKLYLKLGFERTPEFDCRPYGADDPAITYRLLLK